MSAARKTARRPPAASRANRLPASPWAKVRRIRLIHREVRESLSIGALDLLLANADIVVEGGGEIVSAGASAGRVYATVMVTIDLERCAPRFREPADAATAERVAELMRDTPAMQRRLVDLARPRLGELAQASLATLEISLHVNIRADGRRVLVDGDVMAWPREHRRG